MKANNHPSFEKKGAFSLELEQKVGDYFKQHNLSIKGNQKLYIKAVIIAFLWLVFYVLAFVKQNQEWLQVLYGIATAFLTVSIGFNLGHDALHGAFSTKKKVNRLLGHSFDFAGVSSFIWDTKHNKIHHNWTNVLGHDDDIEARPLLRLHQGQTWYGIHRFQHWYFLLAYAILFFYWVFVTDFKKIITKNINGHKITVSRKEVFFFLCWKAVFCSVFIVLPIILVGWIAWIFWFIAFVLVSGAYMSIIFQMAHVVDCTEQPIPVSGIPLEELKILQVKTTANFAPQSKFWNYITGGLNHQIEHHLFPKIAHIHYESIAPIVKEVCKKHNVPYNEYGTFRDAFRAHVHRLKELSIP